MKNNFNITFCCFNELVCFTTYNAAMAKKVFLYREHK